MPAAYLESVNIGLDNKFCKEERSIRFRDFEYFQFSKNLRKTSTWISSVVLLSHTCEISLLVLCWINARSHIVWILSVLIAELSGCLSY